MPLNLLNTVGSAHFWPHFKEENCDALERYPYSLAFMSPNFMIEHNLNE
jgi:hypothetical protein